MRKKKLSRPGIVLSIASEKGGVGKTTLTELIAIALFGKPYLYSILVIDGDTQFTLSDDREEEEKFDNKTGFDLLPYFHSNEGEKMEGYLSLEDILDLSDKDHPLREKYDFIFIDIPGRADGAEIAAILYSCDFVFVPLVPGSKEAKSVKRFLPKLKKIEEIKKAKGKSFVINSFFNREDKSLETKDLKTFAKDTDINVMTGRLRKNKIYERGASTLYSILEEKANKDEIQIQSEFKKFMKEFNNILIN